MASKGKDGQHTCSNFRKEFREFWAYPKNRPRPRKRPRPRGAAAFANRGWRSRRIAQSVRERLTEEEKEEGPGWYTQPRIGGRRGRAGVRAEQVGRGPRPPARSELAAPGELTVNTVSNGH